MHQLTSKRRSLGVLLPTLAVKLQASSRGCSAPGVTPFRDLALERTEKSARALWLIGLHLGDTTPVPQNKAGHLLGHVYDLGCDPALPQTRIYTTSIAQPYHTDSADLVGLSAAGGGRRRVSGRLLARRLRRARPNAAGSRERAALDKDGVGPKG